MNSLVLFDGFRCLEFSPLVLPSELPFVHNLLSLFAPDTPLIEQISLPPNIAVNLTDELSVLFCESEPAYFSTCLVKPIRVGSSPRDHIRLEDSAAAFALYEDHLTVMDQSGVYLNGEKVPCGEYPFVTGDRIWAGSSQFVRHDGYLACIGTQYLSRLNLCTFTPQVYEDFPYYMRSPRIIKREPAENLELTPPRPKEERKKGELFKVIIPPLVMAMVTAGGGILMGRGIFVLISAAAMLVSMVFSATTFISESKTRREKEKERDDSYDRYLLEQRKRIYQLYETQRDSLLYHNLSPKEIERKILSYSSRLFERSANDSDFLTLSLGYSTVPASFRLKCNIPASPQTEDPLLEEMQELRAFYQNIPDMPTVIDFKQAHLGLVGEKVNIHRQLAAILTQLCFYQSYHDIEIILLVAEEDRAGFEWARWYPHCRIKNINVTGLVSGENQRDQVLGNIAQVLKARRQKQEEEKKDSRYLPHYIFIIDNPKLIINHSIMEYLQTEKTTLGFSLIYTTHIQANLPDNIQTVFILDGGDHGTLLLNEGNLLKRPVILPAMEGIDLEIMARKLAPIRHSQGISTQIPESVTFFDLYNVKRPEEIPVLQLWEKNACHKSLAVPLGLRGKDDLVSLNLHEKAHGPHGLVAGTTGSGKSEIVQSYILSLAVNFHPHEVGFLLIDYKGGGMANLFANLPHLLGTITNLDGSESMRALASIKSELARRQRIFNDNNVNNINQYSKLFKAKEADLPLPHLFIISDEFAELKKEQPDFMSELVSAARIGRSLGVHLILATQKPSGVVDDQIWSNSKFKLALKMANEADSNEVLKTPDAARITQAGRAYLQVGNNEVYELFQSAFSGASYSEEVVQWGFDSRVYLINQLGQGVLLNEDLSLVDKTRETKLTQLDVTVNHLQELYQGLKAAPVEKPWLPPLPAKLVTQALRWGIDVGQIESPDLSVPIGMADIPEEQQQREFLHNFLEDGNLAVFGASGFGKSTVLMTTALTLASRNSPGLLNFFILDYGNSALAQLRGLPHTADYLVFDDSEKLSKLVKLLSEELKRRKALFAAANALNFRMYNELTAKKLAAIMVFIDNYDLIRELGFELEEFLVKLSRDGTGLGIYTVITASRASVVRYSVLNNFKNKIAQFMFDNADVMAVVGRCPYKLPEMRGRALVKIKEVHVAQSYLPLAYEDDIAYAKLIGEVIAAIAEQNSAPKASGIRVLPDTIFYKDLLPYLRINERQALIGFDPESTSPLYLDLAIGSQMIIGGPTSGKTNILKIILTQFKGAKCFIVDSRAGDLQDFKEWPEIVYLGSESQLAKFKQKLLGEVERRLEAQKASALRLRDFCAAQPPALLIIDDADNFVELCKAETKELEQILPKAMELGISFIITTLPSRMRGYDNLTKILKDSQAGIVLANPADQNILPIPPPRGYKIIPDRGFWYKRGDIRQIKLPLIDSVRSCSERDDAL